MLPEHFFVSGGGDLHDTRQHGWPETPIRRRYKGHFSIKGLNEVKAALRQGPYTDLGGYPVYFIMQDGSPLSFQTVMDNWPKVVNATLSDPPGHGCVMWQVESIHVNYENTTLYDAHTGERIPAAYEE